MDKKYHITYNGRTLDTNYWEPISDEEYNSTIHEYYDKPDKSLVLKQLKQISEGGKKVNYITHYYFRELMSRVKIHYNPWTIKDVFSCKKLVEYFKAKTTPNKKVYPEDWSLARKMYKAFSIAGKGVASPPTQFKLSVVDEILKKYNVNNHWYDFSCGWGIRLLGALRNNVSYYGVDPNYELDLQLNDMCKDYEEATGREITRNDVQIRLQGSETYYGPWNNWMGLAFSSPPYFDLEDYKIGKQSYKEGTTYQEWIDNYVRPTIQNVYKYLIDGGYFCTNINNTHQHKLFDDWQRIALEEGFKFVCIEDMKNKHRVYGVQGDTSGEVKEYNNDEKILILQK